MNIHHHHTIHLCSACSCSRCGHPRRDAAPSNLDEPRSRSSILDVLGNLAPFAALLSLLHVTGEGRGDQARAEQASTAPVTPPIAEMLARRDDHDVDGSRSGTKAVHTSNEPPKPDAFLTLFSRVAREHEHGTTATEVRCAPASVEVKPPLSPLAAAFLAAFRDDPNLA